MTALIEAARDRPMLLLLYVTALVIAGTMLSGTAIKLNRMYWIGEDHTGASKLFTVASFLSYGAGVIILSAVVGFNVGGSVQTMLRSPPKEVAEIVSTPRQFMTMADAMNSSMEVMTKELDTISYELEQDYPMDGR